MTSLRSVEVLGPYWSSKHDIIIEIDEPTSEEGGGGGGGEGERAVEREKEREGGRRESSRKGERERREERGRKRQAPLGESRDAVKVSLDGWRTESWKMTLVWKYLLFIA